MVEFLKFVAKQTSFDPELVEVLASALGYSMRCCWLRDFRQQVRGFIEVGR